MPEGNPEAYGPHPTEMLRNRNIQALLRTIRYAEGTDEPDGYGTTFTHQKFDNNAPHPKVIYRGGGEESDAHGAYQFLSTTWEWVHGGKNVPMTSETQDMAALQLISNRGIDARAPITREGIDKLCWEWASLPNLKGLSHYGQPTKTYDELYDIYQKELTRPNYATGYYTGP